MNRYQIENMKCNGCVSAVKNAVEQLEGVVSADVNLESKIAEVDGEIDAALVERTLAAIGYPAKLIT